MEREARLSYHEPGGQHFEVLTVARASVEGPSARFFEGAHLWSGDRLTGRVKRINVGRPQAHLAQVILEFPWRTANLPRQVLGADLAPRIREGITPLSAR